VFCFCDLLQCWSAVSWRDLNVIAAMLFQVEFWTRRLMGLHRCRGTYKFLHRKSFRTRPFMLKSLTQRQWKYVCHRNLQSVSSSELTHTRLTALFLGLPRWTSARKVKPIWILLKQETVSGSGISWAVCKSAPRSRQITMPAPHHSAVN